MARLLAVSRVLLSPVLLGIIAAYQAGIYVDMRMFTSVASPLNDVADILKPRLWWNDDEFSDVDPFATFDRVVTAWYAEGGHSRLTKLFGCMPRMRDIVVAHAVYSGNLGVLSRLPVVVVGAVEMALLDLAAMKGHLDVVKYLHAVVGHIGCTTWAVDSASLQGHLEIVVYLLANRREGYSWKVIERAAVYGHLEMVVLLHANKPLSSRHLDVALRAAACHNHFAIVSYLLDEFGPAERYSDGVLDGTARHGRLEMVQFLHERNFECSTNAMDYAAANGHLDVVKWLHENRTEGCTEDAMDCAALDGHLDVVQWLHDHRQEGCTSFALFKAVKYSQWDTALFLATHRSEVAMALGLDCAMASPTIPAAVLATLKAIADYKNATM